MGLLGRVSTPYILFYRDLWDHLGGLTDQKPAWGITNSTPKIGAQPQFGGENGAEAEKMSQNFL